MIVVVKVYFYILYWVVFVESVCVGFVLREIKEMSVEVIINLDGIGICDCDIGIFFLDYMFDVSIKFFYCFC